MRGSRRAWAARRPRRSRTCAAGPDYELEILRQGGDNHGTSAALDAFAELARDDVPYTAGLLKGFAAYCAFGMGTTFEPRLSSELGVALRRSNAQRPRAAALGRLHRSAAAEPMEEPSAATVWNASAVSLQQLMGAPTGDPNLDCARFVEGLFPDHFDAAYFDLVVPTELYDRMESVVRTVRATFASALRTDSRLRDALLDPDTMARHVEDAQLSVPGAPRGSWAAPNRALADPPLAAGAGVFVMALEQSRTLFLDRMDLVRTATNMCEGPAVFHPLYANAYIQPSAKCVVMLLGMARRPWADAAYDDASLLFRWGYIVAHELAHLSMNTGYASNVDTTLLRNYEVGTRDESMADALGLLALMHHPTLQSGDPASTGAAELCAHLSQTWCARTPLFYESWPLSSHPRANARGDAGCETLRDAGYDVARSLLFSRA
jgi:hypothetical protein